MSSGADAPEHVQLRQRGDHLFIGHRVEFGARLDTRAQPEFVGDRAGGDRVVAGDHADVDAGGQGAGDGVLGLGAQRVDDADQRHEQQVVHGTHRVADRRGHRVGIEATHGERQHPQALLRQPLVRREQVVAPFVDRHLLAVPQHVGAAVEHHVGRTLHRREVGLLEHVGGQPVRAVVERRHELVLRIERHLRTSGQRPPRLLCVDAELRREDHECRFGRVADHRPVVADGRVGAEGQAERQLMEIRRRLAGHAQDGTGLRVAATVDLEPGASHQHRGRRHRVHGQRAGLVAVDHRRAAERLDVGERLDDRLGLGQSTGSRRQDRLHECRQAGRDRRDRGGDAQQGEGLEVLVAHEADDRDDADGDRRQQAEHLREVVELLLER